MTTSSDGPGERASSDDDASTFGPELDPSLRLPDDLWGPAVDPVTGSRGMDLAIDPVTLAEGLPPVDNEAEWFRGQLLGEEGAQQIFGSPSSPAALAGVDVGVGRPNRARRSSGSTDRNRWLPLASACALAVVLLLVVLAVQHRGSRHQIETARPASPVVTSIAPSTSITPTTAGNPDLTPASPSAPPDGPIAPTIDTEAATTVRTTAPPAPSAGPATTTRPSPAPAAGVPATPATTAVVASTAPATTSTTTKRPRPTVPETVPTTTAPTTTLVPG